MLISWLSLIMGLGAMGVSTYYSIVWFLDRGMPTPLAFIMAIIYVGFANLVFEFAIERLKKAQLWRNKKLSLKEGTHGHNVAAIHARSFLVVGSLFFLGWVVLAGFSMFCTVGGQYDQLMFIDTVEDPDKPLIIDYSKNIELKEKQLSTYQTRYDQLLIIAGSVDSVEKRWTYRNTSGGNEESLADLETKIEGLNNELSEMYLKQGLKDVSDERGVNTDSFYIYISDITKGKIAPLKVQFYSALFPSIVFDILSPICLTIFVFGWTKRRNK